MLFIYRTKTVLKFFLHRTKTDRQSKIHLMCTISIHWIDSLVLSSVSYFTWNLINLYLTKHNAIIFVFVFYIYILFFGHILFIKCYSLRLCQTVNNNCFFRQYIMCKALCFSAAMLTHVWDSPDSRHFDVPSIQQEISKSGFFLSTQNCPQR